MTSACYDCPKLLGWQHTHVVYCQLGHDNAYQGVAAMTVACQSCKSLWAECHGCTGMPLHWLCKDWPHSHTVEVELGFCCFGILAS